MSIAIPTESQSKSLANKSRGAFYTAKTVADFLVRWGVRSSLDTVLDPSFGGGVFLESACERLLTLGGEPSEQVFGVELDAETHASVCELLAKKGSADPANLWHRDFFDVEPLPVYQVSVAVGNPPFIRYQRFATEIRERALTRANEQGVKLTQLSSSWAPFIVHATAMVKEGGRLAFVLPAEIGHAKYATAIIKYLVRSFGRITILTFQEKLFPHLSEDTVLILAQDKGQSTNSIFIRDLKSHGSLAKIVLTRTYKLNRTRRIDAEPILNRTERLVEYFLPKKTRELYRELKNSDLVTRLGDLVDVGIGYVTGANDFFHLSPAEVRRFAIPKEFLRPAVRRGRALLGLRFTEDDWQKALVIGDAGYLLHIQGQSELPSGINDYLKIGSEAGVAKGFKCRSRSPWYSVPYVSKPDAFLSYMSGVKPRLVANEAGAVAPNTLHVLRIKDADQRSAQSVASLWATSLSRLSAEIEGHPLGGGMLKLEPTEAENTIVAMPKGDSRSFNWIYSELDLMVRSGNDTEARDLADRHILSNDLGLSKMDCVLLNDGAELLMNRRYRREL